MASLGKSPFGSGKLPLSTVAQLSQAAGENNKDEDNKHSSKDKDKGREHGKEASSKRTKVAEEKGVKEREQPPAARIVAYSDSEGDDEPLYKQRRRRKKEKQEAEEATATEDDEPVDLRRDEEASTSGRGERLEMSRGREGRLAGVRRLCARGMHSGAQQVRGSCSWTLLLQVAALWLLHWLRPREAKAFELLSLAIPLPDALATSLGWRAPSTLLPGWLSRLSGALAGFAKPSVLVGMGNGISSLWPRQRTRIHQTISQSVLVLQQAEGTRAPNTPTAATEGATPPKRRPQLAAEHAKRHSLELAEMKRILASHSASLPPERFDATDAELLRYAASCGLLQARSPEERAVAIQEGAQQVLNTLAWLRRYRFLPNHALRKWTHLVRWQGTDDTGRPILVVRIGQACSDCQGGDADTLAQAIISQVQRAVTEVLSNEHGPDQLLVVLDARWAQSLDVTRNVRLFKDASATLLQHFPMRLHQLFVVELDPALRWVLDGLNASPEKVRSVALTDATLPLHPSALDPARYEPPGSDRADSADRPLPQPENTSQEASSHREEAGGELSSRSSVSELPIGSPPFQPPVWPPPPQPQPPGPDLRRSVSLDSVVRNRAPPREPSTPGINPELLSPQGAVSKGDPGS